MRKLPSGQMRRRNPSAGSLRRFPRCGGSRYCTHPRAGGCGGERGSEIQSSAALNPKVVAHCVEKGYPITPGTSSPSDVEQALSFGLEVVKFFPAEAAGGIGMIKAMSAPYGGVKFMPTGGVNAKNLRSYLDFSKGVGLRRQLDGADRFIK